MFFNHDEELLDFAHLLEILLIALQFFYTLSSFLRFILVRSDKKYYFLFCVYTFITANKKVGKHYSYYFHLRQDIRSKLKRIAENPHHACDAHKLHGHLEDKWGCWLGSNIRMIYEIDDHNKVILIFAIGTHSVYG